MEIEEVRVPRAEHRALCEASPDKPGVLRCPVDKNIEIWNLHDRYRILEEDREGCMKVPKKPQMLVCSPDVVELVETNEATVLNRRHCRWAPGKAHVLLCPPPCPGSASSHKYRCTPGAQP
jgi:hypothetical protein